VTEPVELTRPVHRRTLGSSDDVVLKIPCPSRACGFDPLLRHQKHCHVAVGDILLAVTAIAVAWEVFTDV
jgi:hypothetical protein